MKIYGIIREYGQSYIVKDLTDRISEEMLVEGGYSAPQIVQDVAEHESPLFTLICDNNSRECLFEFTLWLDWQTGIREGIPCTPLLEAISQTPKIDTLYFCYNGDRWVYSPYSEGSFSFEILEYSVYLRIEIMHGVLMMEVSRPDLLEALQNLHSEE